MRIFSAILVAGLAALTACDGMRGNQQGSGSEAKPTKTGDPSVARIGEYGSMTGSEATFGQSTHNGIMLAVEEQNGAGGVKGKKIELVGPYDTAGKTSEAGNAVTRLITSDRVIAVLGEVASSLSLAGGRVAQQNGVPMITPSSTNAQVTQIGDMIFRVCFIDPYQGYVAAKFLAENLKQKKVAILYDQGQAYSVGLKDDFKKAFTELGGSITTEQAYTGGDQDFSAQLTTIGQTKPESIFVPGYYTDAGNIALQARKKGITVPLVGGDGWDSSKLTEIGGKAIEGSYYTNHYSHEEQRPEVQAFVKKYQAKFGGVPDGLAALGYDAAKLLFDAMGRASAWDGKSLAGAIAATKDFKGVTGNISIDPERNAIKSAVVLQIKEGKPSYVATIEPKK